MYKTYLYLLITFVIWGSLYVVSKFVLEKIPVMTISFLRYLIAGTLLYGIVKRKSLPPIARQDYKYLFFIGFFGYFVAMATQLVGTKLSNASLAALVNSMNPVVIMLFAVVILKEKLTIKKILCGILAIAGVFIIVGDVDGGAPLAGILISVFSVVLWSWVSVSIRKITQTYDPLQITAYGMIIAAVCTLPFAAWEVMATPTPDLQFDAGVVLSLLYIGIICTALAHVLWNKSLSRIEAGACSLFYPLQPMSAALLGWMFLGECISTNFVVGAVLIIGGVLFSILGK